MITFTEFIPIIIRNKTRLPTIIVNLQHIVLKLEANNT